MVNLILGRISSFLFALRKLQTEQFFAAILIGLVLLTSNINLDRNTQDLGDRIHDRLQQTDQYSERPKTTGEFLDEARGDIPLDERLHNITRDSAEAMKQLGQEYTSGVKENIRSFRDNASKVVKEPFDRN